MVYCVRLINGYHSRLHGLLRETNKRLSFECTGLLRETDKRLSFEFTWFTA